MKRRSGPRKTASLSESIHHQLNMYALAAGAAGASVLALAQSAEAKIIYTPAHQKILPHSTFHLDLNHDGSIDFDLVNASVSSGLDRNLYVNVVPRSAGQILGKKTLYASALTAGISVGPHRRFSRSNQIMASWYVRVSTNTYIGYRGQWANSGKGLEDRYLGLSFDIKGKKHFGWARLSVMIARDMGAPNLIAALTGYAYETIPNKPIITGKKKGANDSTNENFAPEPSLTNPIPSTPQPASLGMLSLGANGVPLWRRKESLGDTQ